MFRPLGEVERPEVARDREAAAALVQAWVRWVQAARPSEVAPLPAELAAARLLARSAAEHLGRRIRKDMAHPEREIPA